VSGLTTADATRWFFLEADRATMLVERSNFKHSSFLRKLAPYRETWRPGIIKDSFHYDRPLFVRPQQIHAILAAGA
jgi:hypothetical protein